MPYDFVTNAHGALEGPAQARFSLSFVTVGGCARQPMTGRHDARLLAGMLDFSVSKYYLASANILERQQDFVNVSKYYLLSANILERQQIIFSVSKYS